MTKILAILIITSALFYGQDKNVASVTTRRIVRMEDVVPPTAEQLMKFEGAIGTQQFNTGVAQNAPIQARGSKVAMVLVAGTPSDNVAVGINAIVHTRIPANSIFGLQVLKWGSDGKIVTNLEGVQVWNRDVLPGEVFNIKLPGGGMLFETTKQYELIIVDGVTLDKTVDFIPAITGNPPIIQKSPQVASLPTGPVIQVDVTNGGAPVDAVVMNGIVFTSTAFRSTFSATTGNETLLIGLFENCLGGEVRLTVVRSGQSDTTVFRFPEGTPQNCGKG